MLLGSLLDGISKFFCRGCLIPKHEEFLSLWSVCVGMHNNISEGFIETGYIAYALWERHQNPIIPSEKRITWVQSRTTENSGSRLSNVP